MSKLSPKAVGYTNLLTGLEDLLSLNKERILKIHSKMIRTNSYYNETHLSRLNENDSEDITTIDEGIG